MSRRKQTNPQPMKRLVSPVSDGMQSELINSTEEEPQTDEGLSKKLLLGTGNSSTLTEKSSASNTSVGEDSPKKMKKKKRTNSSSSSLSSSSSTSDLSSVHSPPLVLLTSDLSTLSNNSKSNVNSLTPAQEMPEEKQDQASASSEPINGITNGVTHPESLSDVPMQEEEEEDDEESSKYDSKHSQNSSHESEEEPDKKRKASASPPLAEPPQKATFSSLSSSPPLDTVDGQLSAMQLLAKYQSQFAQLQAQLIAPSLNASLLANSGLLGQTSSVSDRLSETESQEEEAQSLPRRSPHTSSTLDKLTSIVDSIDKIRVAPGSRNGGSGGSLAPSPCADSSSVDLLRRTRALDHSSPGDIFGGRRSLKSPGGSSQSSGCASPGQRVLSGNRRPSDSRFGIALDQSASPVEEDEPLGELGSPLDFSVRGSESPRRKRRCTPDPNTGSTDHTPLDLSCKAKEDAAAQLASLSQLLSGNLLAASGLAANPLLAAQLVGSPISSVALGAQLTSQLLAAAAAGNRNLLGVPLGQLLNQSVNQPMLNTSTSSARSSTESPAANRTKNSSKFELGKLDNMSSGLSGLGNLLQSVSGGGANVSTNSSSSSSSGNTSFGKIGGLWNGVKLKNSQYSASAQLHQPNPKQMQLRERSSNGQGRANPWQTQWMNRSSEQNRDVFTCVWCKQSFRSLQEMTEHMKVSPRCGMAGMQQAQAASAANSLNTPVSAASGNSVSSVINAVNSSSVSVATKSKSAVLSTSNALGKDKDKGAQMPRKLVRGQDVWLGRGAEQTRQILKCMWCAQSFKSLDEMTKHMKITQHYTNIISQEQITSWKSPEERAANEVNQVLTCKICDESFSSLKDLSTHIVKSSHFSDTRVDALKTLTSSDSSKQSFNLSSAAQLAAAAASHSSTPPSSADSRKSSGKERRKKSLPVRKLLELERNVPDKTCSDSPNGASSCSSSPLSALANNSQLTKTFVEGMQKLLQAAAEPKGESSKLGLNDDLHKNPLLAQTGSGQLLSLLMAAAAAAGMGGSANSLNDRKSPLSSGAGSIMGGESGPPSTLGDIESDQVNASAERPERADSRHSSVSACGLREAKEAAEDTPNEPISGASSEPKSGGSVLSALEQLIEKNFDCKSKKSATSQGILQRLGIDEEVCPPWQTVNSSSPSNSNNGNFYSWSP